MVGRAPYLLAGVVGLAVLLALAAIEPRGDAWTWDEFPRRMTLIAFAVGMAGVASGRLRWSALVIPVATCVGDYGFEWFHARAAIKELGWPDIPAHDKELMIQGSFEVVAPWLVGGCYAALAAMSGWRTSDRRDRRRAGVWLAVVAAIGTCFVLGNDHWLTLENLTQPGTYVTSVPWPDSKILAMVLCAGAAMTSVVMLVSGRRRDQREPA